jgi:hypothetical protein
LFYGAAQDAHPFGSFHEHLHRCFDAFGPERMFWRTTSRRYFVPGGVA